MSDSDNDQRDYFRIQDELMLRWELAQADELTATELDAELKDVNDRLDSMINVAFGESPVVAEALGLLNRKINLFLERRDNVHHILKHVKVNLSGAGIGFFWERPAPNDQIIDITIRLEPSKNEVTMRTEILSCDPVRGDDEEGYWVRGRFVANQDLGVEQIVRHVSFRQTQLLAQKRRGEDFGEWYEDDDTEED
jgi:hypothetical protein